jgi:hypothetical protein
MVPRAENIISLCARLQQQLKRARKTGHDAEAYDLRLAITYLRVFASEAKEESNPARRAKLQQEASDLCQEAMP